MHHGSHRHSGPRSDYTVYDHFPVSPRIIHGLLRRPPPQLVAPAPSHTSHSKRICISDKVLGNIRSAPRTRADGHPPGSRTRLAQTRNCAAHDGLKGKRDGGAPGGFPAGRGWAHTVHLATNCCREGSIDGASIDRATVCIPAATRSLPLSVLQRLVPALCVLFQSSKVRRRCYVPLALC